MKKITAAAPGGGGIEFETFLGKLFVIEPLEVEHGINTVHGEKDAVRANVYVLVGKDKTEEFEDTLIFPKVLQSQTRRKIGEIVVGRLEQGEAKKGQKPPWVLAAATEQDLKKATAFLTSLSVKSASDDDDDEYDEDDDEDSF